MAVVTSDDGNNSRPRKLLSLLLPKLSRRLDFLIHLQHADGELSGP
jgi:hypothetical protein